VEEEDDEDDEEKEAELAAQIDMFESNPLFSTPDASEKVKEKESVTYLTFEM